MATLTNISPIATWTNSSTDTRTYFDWQAQSWIGTSTYLESYTLAYITEAGTYSGIFRTASNATGIRIKHNGAIQDLEYIWITSNVSGLHKYYTRAVVSSANPLVVNGIQLSNIMLLDLTLSYGAGNEPTKEWCDANIPYFTGTMELTPWKTTNNIYVKTNPTYYKVDWIRPASNYVVTSIKCTSQLKIQFKATINEVTGGIIFGNVDLGDNSDWRIFNYSSKIYLDIGSGRKYGSSMTAGSTYEWEVGNLYVKNLRTGSNLISGTTQTWTPASDIYLYIETTPTIYYLKGFQGSTLTHSYIPVVRASDSRPGLYDEVNNVFLDTGDGTTYGGDTSPWKPVSAVYIKYGNHVDLPSGYTQLEYIEATGSQSINTGVSGAATWEFDIQYNSTFTQTRQLMGYPNSMVGYWGVVNGYYGLDSESLTEFPAGNRDIFRIEYYQGFTKWYINEFNCLIINGTPVDGDPCTLFSLGESGHTFHYAKLYSCKVYSDVNRTNLIRDFVPCKRNSDNVVGLFDLVYDSFYESATGSSFTAGTVIGWKQVNLSKVRTF